MITFLSILALPILIALVVMLVFKGKVTWQEFAAECAVLLMVVGISLLCTYFGRTSDLETLNGSVTGKQRNVVHCRHSYDCNCVDICSGSGQSRSCTRVCQTCYEHSYDVDWNVFTTLGTIPIETVDRQGVTMPQRWAIAYATEPVARPSAYTNYILAAPDSVLRPTYIDAAKYKSFVPPYPQVSDYYHIQRYFNMGVPNRDDHEWQWLLDKTNADIGASKQANIIVVVVPTDDAHAAKALQDNWVGGKKNDIIVVLGSKNYPKIDFAEVVSWSPSRDFKVELRDKLLEIGTLARRDDIVATIKDETQRKYIRMHMKEYEYLSRAYQPTKFVSWVLFIVATLLSIGMSIWAVLNEFTDEAPNGEEDYYSSRRRRDYVWKD